MSFSRLPARGALACLALLSCLAFSTAAQELKSEQLFPLPEGIKKIDRDTTFYRNLKKAIKEEGERRGKEMKDALTEDDEKDQYSLFFQPEGSWQETSRGLEVLVPAYHANEEKKWITMERWILSRSGDEVTFESSEPAVMAGMEGSFERVNGRNLVISAQGGRVLTTGEEPVEAQWQYTKLVFTEGEFRPLLVKVDAGYELRGFDFIGKGRITYLPPDRIQKQYLWHYLAEEDAEPAYKDLRTLKTEFTYLRLEMSRKKSQQELPWMLGMDPEVIKAMSPAEDDDPFLETRKDIVSDLSKGMQSNMGWSNENQHPNTFGWLAKTDHTLGWMGLFHDPDDALENTVFSTKEKKKGFSKNRVFYTLGRYHSDAELDNLARVNATGGLLASELKLKMEHEVRDQVFMDKFSGVVSIDKRANFHGQLKLDFTMLHRKIDRLPITISPYAQIEYVRDEQGQEMPYFRSGSTLVLYPQPVWKKKKGEEVKKSIFIGYYDEKIISKLSPSFYSLAGFGTPWIPYYRFWTRKEMDLITRVPEKNTAISVGELQGSWQEEKFQVDHWKTTDFPIEAPILMFGKFHDPEKSGLTENIDGTPVRYFHGKDSISSSGFMYKISTANAKKAFADAANSLKLFEEILGPFPYPKLDLITSPLHGFSAQSPPSVVFVGPIFLVSEAEMANMGGSADGAYGVVAHELAHQWWGSVIAPVNDYHYWWVESLAEVGFGWFLTRNAEDAGRFEKHVEGWKKAALRADKGASVMDASHRAGGRDYQGLVYMKGPYVWYTLEQILDQDVFGRYLSTFIKQYYGKDVTTRDFQRHLEQFTTLQAVQGNKEVTADNFASLLEAYQKTGGDFASWEWFFDDWFRGTGIPHFKWNHTVSKTSDGNHRIHFHVEQEVHSGDKVREGDSMRILIPTGIYFQDGTYTKVLLPMMNGQILDMDMDFPKPIKKVVFNQFDAVLCEIDNGN